jgi:hypothetical protein
MSFYVDVNRFIEGEESGKTNEKVPLSASTLGKINEYKAYLKGRKGVYSENDSLGKAITDGSFGDIASAHFSRWIGNNYEIGCEDC